MNLLSFPLKASWCFPTHTLNIITIFLLWNSIIFHYKASENQLTLSMLNIISGSSLLNRNFFFFFQTNRICKYLFQTQIFFSNSSIRKQSNQIQQSASKSHKSTSNSSWKQTTPTFITSQTSKFHIHTYNTCGNQQKKDLLTKQISSFYQK